MSNLLTGDPSSLASGNSDNGGFRPTGGAPTSQSPGPKTPREIMADRRRREQIKKENEEARRKLAEEDGSAARTTENRLSSGGRRPAAAGVARGNEGEGSGAQPSQLDDPNYRRSQGTAGGAQTGGRTSTGRTSNGNGQKATGNAAAQQPAAYAPTSGNVRQQMEPMATRRDQGNGNGAAPTSSGRPRASSASQGQPRQQVPAESSTYRAQAPPNSGQPQSRGATAPQPSSQNQPRATGTQQSRAGTEETRTRNPNQSSFPHAFERWETLSSHWEGLTSYWIRRLQDNSSEINQQPLNQQMSRQITDLSAAGANLFHAVVELQRLRASSERKFQRWFLETSSEKERSMEVQAELQNLVNRERELRTEAGRAVARMDSEKSNAERLVNEMKRELQISKEEARRAWEELGRREQEERDRTRSLREGEPTIVGGVQVVPMSGGLSRGPSSANRPSTRDGPYPGGPNRGVMGGQDDSRYTTAGYDPSLTAAEDPFVEGSRQERPSTSGSGAPDLPIQGATAPAVPIVRNYPAIPAPQTQPIVSTAASRQSSTTATAPPASSSSASRGGFYQHQGIALSGSGPGATTTTATTGPADFPDDETISEEEPEIDAHGNFRVDQHGRRIPYQAPAPVSSAGGAVGGAPAPHYNDLEDPYDEPGHHEQAYQRQFSGVSASPAYATGGSGTVGPSQQGGQGGFEPADYGGQGYTGWEAVRTHHHPTRLSDVLEEDERSRTSPSRASMDNGSRR